MTVQAKCSVLVVIILWYICAGKTEKQTVQVKLGNWDVYPTKQEDRDYCSFTVNVSVDHQSSLVKSGESWNLRVYGKTPSGHYTPSQLESGTYNNDKLTLKGFEFSENTRNCYNISYICIEGGNSKDFDFVAVGNLSCSEKEIFTPCQNYANQSKCLLETMLELEDLEKYLNATSEKGLNVSDLNHIANILENISASVYTSPNVTKRVFKSLDEILNTDKEVFTEAQAINTAPSRILRALEEQLSSLHNTPDNNVTYEGINLGAYVGSIDKRDRRKRTKGEVKNRKNGVRFSVKRRKQKILIEINVTDSTFEYSNTDATVYLPVGSEEKTDVIILAFNDSKLFRPNDTDLDTAGFVVSTAIEGEELNNNDTIVTTFQMSSRETGNRSCVSWNSSSNPADDDWSKNRCITVPDDDGIVTCHCKHTGNNLASFAVLLGFPGSTPLSVFSYIGLGISIFSLCITVVTYLLIKSMRDTYQNRILLNLCISLLLFYVIFAAGIKKYQNEPRELCTTIAVLLHYFTLSSVAWMSAEAVTLYLSIAQLFSFLTLEARKATIIAWGLPLLVVIPAVSIAKLRQQYYHDNVDYCFIHPGSLLIYGQIVPIGICVVLNCFIYAIVMTKLMCRRRITGSNQQEIWKEYKKHIRRGMAILVVVGLTWIFGAFVFIDKSSTVFQYVFVLCNTLQGFFIFLFFCLLQPECRKASKTWLLACGNYCCYWRTARKVSSDDLVEIPMPEINSASNDVVLSQESQETSVTSESTDANSRPKYRGRWVYQN